MQSGCRRERNPLLAPAPTEKPDSNNSATVESHFAQTTRLLNLSPLELSSSPPSSRNSFRITLFCDEQGGGGRSQNEANYRFSCDLEDLEVSRSRRKRSSANADIWRNSAHVATACTKQSWNPALRQPAARAGNWRTTPRDPLRGRRRSQKSSLAAAQKLRGLRDVRLAVSRTVFAVARRTSAIFRRH